MVVRRLFWEEAKKSEKGKGGGEEERREAEGEKGGEKRCTYVHQLDLSSVCVWVVGQKSAVVKRILVERRENLKKK